jgi:hypothetical protein
VLPADGRRAQIVTARVFVDTLARKGGKPELLLLPEVGLRGNSHFAFSDLTTCR